MITSEEMHILFHTGETVQITDEFGEVTVATLTAPLYPHIGQHESHFFSEIPVRIEGHLRSKAGIVERI